MFSKNFLAFKAGGGSNENFPSLKKISFFYTLCVWLHVRISPGNPIEADRNPRLDLRAAYGVTKDDK